MSHGDRVQCEEPFVGGQRMSSEDDNDPIRLDLVKRTWLHHDDDARIAVNLLIFRMRMESIPRVSLVARDRKTAIAAHGGTGNQISEEWPPITVGLSPIRRCLTIMSNPPHFWWHRLPFWYQLPFEMSERIDELFWNPPPLATGHVEFFVNNEVCWVRFEAVSHAQVELVMLKDGPESQ